MSIYFPKVFREWERGQLLLLMSSGAVQMTDRQVFSRASEEYPGTDLSAMCLSRFRKCLGSKFEHSTIHNNYMLCEQRNI